MDEVGMEPQGGSDELKKLGEGYLLHTAVRHAFDAVGRSTAGVDALLDHLAGKINELGAALVERGDDRGAPEVAGGQGCGRAGGGR